MENYSFAEQEKKMKIEDVRRKEKEENFNFTISTRNKRCYGKYLKINHNGG